MTDLKRNVPDLRFPEFEGEWEEKKLGEFVNFGKGKLLGKKDLSEGGKYPCILYGELYTKYGAIINSIQSRTNVNPDKLKKAEKNQVLIPSSGETVEDIATASAIDINEDVYIGGDLNILTPKKDDGKFISLSLNSVNKWNVSRFAQGKTVVHLYNNDLKKLKVKLPIQFEEQQKIGDFFSKLDRQIELEEQKLALLEEQKKGYMQKIFSQELRFKDENGNDYPEWTKKSFQFFMKKPKKLEKGINLNKNQLLTVKLNVNGVSNANTNRALKMGATVYYKRFASQFIYGKQNFFNGAFSIIPNEFDGFYSSGDVPALDIDYSKVNAAYLINYISRKNYYERMESFSSGTGSKRIHEDTLLSFKIKLPVLEEQQKIGNFFNKLDQQIELQGQKVENLKQRKKGLLQKMFV
ncbi:restriction endonuclease subunit S [Staphylococcus pseudintermedius]|uniref:restriction endonuclease subunit S n=1 Tax=Staphylococcus pseudintermedius TaxID=283734 RepID=UPI0028FD0D0E|nr:restriction endonuclease subunit S [Staphylococcus pseudintermedius]MDU0287175.1 restriction endonuclease subunit S [Staphylococcus pseudintermedius]